MYLTIYEIHGCNSGSFVKQYDSDVCENKIGATDVQIFIQNRPVARYVLEEFSFKFTKKSKKY